MSWEKKKISELTSDELKIAKEFTEKELAESSKHIEFDSAMKSLNLQRYLENLNERINEIEKERK